MRLRFVLPALMIGASLFLPVQTPGLAKTSYKQHKYKKFKAHKIKGGKKFNGHKVAKHPAPRH